MIVTTREQCQTNKTNETNEAYVFAKNGRNVNMRVRKVELLSQCDVFSAPP